MFVTSYFKIDGYKSVYYSKVENLIISYLITDTAAIQEFLTRRFSKPATKYEKANQHVSVCFSL